MTVHIIARETKRRPECDTLGAPQVMRRCPTATCRDIFFSDVVSQNPHSTADQLGGGYRSALAQGVSPRHGLTVPG
jgi:hypothetical protein